MVSVKDILMRGKKQTETGAILKSALNTATGDRVFAIEETTDWCYMLKLPAFFLKENNKFTTKKYLFGSIHHISDRIKHTT